MNATKWVVPLCAALAFSPVTVWATPILSSSLASFAVLGASGVTNVPTSTIGGNLGSAPNASVGGGYIFTSGSVQANTALAQQAQLDLDAAILTVNGMGPGITLGVDLTGTIFPGVYTVPAGATNLSGALVLDGGGSNDALWIFLFPSTLITSTTSSVTVINVGDAAQVGVYWSVGSAATLNGLTFAGNVLAQELISSDGNLNIDCGRLLSSEKQVTLNQDHISTGCGGLPSSGFAQGVVIAGPGVPSGNALPEPGTLLLLASGLAGVCVSRKKRAVIA